MKIKVTKATFALAACVMAVLLYGSIAQAETRRHHGGHGGQGYHGGHRGHGYHGGHRGHHPRHWNHHRPSHSWGHHHWRHHHHRRHYGGVVLSFPLIAAAPVGYVRSAYEPEVAFTSEPFQTSQGYCREYQSSARIGVGRQPTFGTACLQPDGSWRIMD